MVQANNRNCEKRDRIAYAYLTAKDYVLKAGYASEIDWQESVSLVNVSEQYFLREAAWVILCTGMREAIVRRLFAPISVAFLGWRSADEIVRSATQCRDDALKLFRHPRKMDSILKIARFVTSKGIAYIKEQLSKEGPKFLEQLPFIGPVTSKHLAKNLGIQVAKSDRHLVRIASALKYSSVDLLCNDIAIVTQQSVNVIDIVLWRYATLRPDYTKFFLMAME